MRALAIEFGAVLLLVDADSDVRVAMWEEGSLPPRGQPPEEVVEVY